MTRHCNSFPLEFRGQVSFFREQPRKTIVLMNSQHCFETITRILYNQTQLCWNFEDLFIDQFEKLEVQVMKVGCTLLNAYFCSLALDSFVLRSFDNEVK